jgi:1,4-dihydroxy-2-naphthoyl-CoA synthase
MGMVHEIYDETGETLFDRGVELAKELNSMHPVAMRNMVQTMRIREDNMGSGIDTALRREAHIQSLCYARDDWGEGLNAAIERRNPSFDSYHHPRDAGL